MILTKDHTPTSFALGTTNSISELAQMIGIAIGSPFIRYVTCSVYALDKALMLHSTLFAFSNTRGIGYLWVIVICSLAVLGDVTASRIAPHRNRT